MNQCTFRQSTLSLLFNAAIKPLTAGFYRGRFVQCDGYEAYDKLTKVDRTEGPWTLIHCWTHARRRFVKRLEKDGSPIAEEALRQIAELYAVKKSVRGMAP